MNPNPDFYRLVGAMQPQHVSDLIVVKIILQNMKGEKQEKKIVFSDMANAWEFYNAQRKMLGGR